MRISKAKELKVETVQPKKSGDILEEILGASSLVDASSKIEVPQKQEEENAGTTLPIST